jgi:uncharacterized membrane protein YdjX (TVP38/TMEM64 family)
MKSDDNKTRIILTISFFINIIFFIIGIVLISRTDITVLRRGMEEFGLLAPVLYIILYTGLCIVPFNPVPKNVVTYFGLASFGPFDALIYTLIGDSIGVTLNYLWAKKFEALIPDVAKDNLSGLRGKRAWLVLIVNRFKPVLEGFAGADYTSYLAGLVKMPYFLFLFITVAVWAVLDAIYFYGLNILLLEPSITGIIVAIMIFSLSYTVLTFLEKRR